MRKIIVAAFALSGLLFGQVLAGPAPTQEIKKATKQCETAIVEHCTSNGGTCHQFCKAVSRGNKALEKCNKECTADKHCKLKPIGGHSNELEAQNNEQLIACIAEVRDPKGEKSGRRMEPWQTIETPSWKKLMEKAKAMEAKEHEAMKAHAGMTEPRAVTAH